MKNYQLKIANYIIRIDATDSGPDILPSQKFRKFLYNAPLGTNYSLFIRVSNGSTELPPDAGCVFHAPYVEENGGTLIEKNPEFWSVWEYNDQMFLKVAFPDKRGNALLKFSLENMEWDLIFDPGQCVVDPLEYPLDGLILYYLTAINGDLLIHASGVNYKGKGYVFSGISGKGKSTISRLWHEAGASVIHDDRLILRNMPGGFRMYNTPIYDNEEPSSSGIDRIFIIEHGPGNHMTLVSGATAMSILMANCIQHNWNRRMIEGLLMSVSGICSKVPVYRLSFKPDSSVTKYIIENG